MELGKPAVLEVTLLLSILMRGKFVIMGRHKMIGKEVVLLLSAQDCLFRIALPAPLS